MGTLALSGGAVTFNTGARLATLHVTMAGASTVTDAVSLAYAGRWTQSAGTLSVAAGQTATFTGAGDTFAGTLAGAGTVAFTAGTDTLNAVNLKATKVNLAGATLTLTGAIANASSVSVTAGKVIVARGGRITPSRNRHEVNSQRQRGQPDHRGHRRRRASPSVRYCRERAVSAAGR